jgi:Protein of unknown function (DUF4058)
MPLRDHVKPPIFPRPWEGFHAMWPGVIVQNLEPHLPDEYVAEPGVHLGREFEVDVGMLEEDRETDQFAFDSGSGGLATATWAPPQPTLTVETNLLDQYAYEVLVFRWPQARKLVAAVEFVSPGNKDRPENRRAFVRKCAAMLQQDVCVSIVDLVTNRKFNLYQEVLAEFGQADPVFSPDASPIYAATCRPQLVNSRLQLQLWSHRLSVGEPLPTLPLWLMDDVAVPLDLEASYEATCRTLRIADPARTPA